jgi:hypothetical protein
MIGEAKANKPAPRSPLPAPPTTQTPRIAQMKTFQHSYAYTDMIDSQIEDLANISRMFSGLVSCGFSHEKAEAKVISIFKRRIAQENSFMDPETYMELSEESLKPFCNDLRLEYGTSSILFAESGVGKSTLAVDLAYACTYGRKALGIIDIDPCDVVYFEFDGNSKTKVMEQYAQISHRDYVAGNKRNYKFTCVQTNRKLSTTEGLEFFESVMTDPKFGGAKRLAIIDSYFGCQSGVDTNSSNARKVIDDVSFINRQLGTVTLFIHHFNKSGTQSGSQTIVDAVNNAMELTKSKAGGRNLKIVKHRMAGLDYPEYEVSYSSTLVPNVKWRCDVRLTAYRMGFDAPDVSKAIEVCSSEYDALARLVSDSGCNKSNWCRRETPAPLSADILRVAPTLKKQLSDNKAARSDFWDKYVEPLKA